MTIIRRAADLVDSQGRGLRHTEATLVLATTLVVTAPQLLRMSWWLMLLAAICVAWRWAIQRQRLRYPGNLTKGALVVAGTLAVVLSSGLVFAVAPAVNLLVVACYLRLLETVRHADAMLVLYLGLFIVGTQFLFDQSIGGGLIGVGGVMCVLATMVVLAQPALLDPGRSPAGGRRATTVSAIGGAFLTSGRLMLEALPLAVLVFVLFPRISPFWEMPLPQTAQTGIPDRVAPGDIASLSQSGALAFRATFAGEPPAHSALYWRTAIYYDLRDGQWRQGPSRKSLVDAAENITPLKAAVDEAGGADNLLVYDVVAEATQRHWLPALGAAERVGGNILNTADRRVLARVPLTTRTGYRVRSLAPESGIVARGAVAEETPDWLIERARQLPESGNPRARALVADWQARGLRDQELVKQLLGFFRQAPFWYTLQPPTVPRDDFVDGFLFDTRSGFCAHYAAASVFLLRAAGLPARLVGGYQGGDINRENGYVTVRQYDAHAWVEVLLADGWYRVDPTAAVAPERIESGVEAALADGEGVLDYPWLLRRAAGLAGMLRFIDNLDHQWNLWVVGYDREVQARFLRDLLGDSSWRRWSLFFVIGMIGLVALQFAALSLREWWRYRARALTPFARLRAFGAQVGCPQDPAETPGTYVERLIVQCPQYTTELRAIATSLNQLLYARDPKPALHDQSMQAIRQLARRQRARLTS